MKKLAFMLLFFFIISGCATGDKKNDSGQVYEKNPEASEQQGEIPGTEPEQSQEKAAEAIERQDQIQEIDPEQSQKRIIEMNELQKKIQDIDSEISSMIKYHHEEIDKLQSEKETLANKLNELYEIEKEYQRKK
jgi:uncharacterized coiled-coil DUF342 family protein